MALAGKKTSGVRVPTHAHAEPIPITAIALAMPTVAPTMRQSTAPPRRRDRLANAVTATGARFGVTTALIERPGVESFGVFISAHQTVKVVRPPSIECV